MNKCCFLACFCTSQRVQQGKAELTLAQIREKLPNGWADRHQIWHTCANSYGNGYTPNKLPLETQGGHLGGITGLTIQTYGEAVRLAPTLVHVYGLIWEWLNTSRPSIPQGAFRGGGGKSVTNSKVLGSCQTAGPIGTKFGTHLQIYLGMDIHQTNCPSRHKGGTWGVLGVNIQKSGEAVKRLDRLAPTLVHVCRFIWEWT